MEEKDKTEEEENPLSSLKDMGYLSYQEKKYEQAIQYFEEAIKLDKSKEELYFFKAKCEESLKQYNKAIKDYIKGLSIKPKDAENLNRLALLYKEIGKFDENEKIIDKLLILDPNNEEYKKNKNLIKKLKEELNELRKKVKNKDFSNVEKICENLLKEASQSYIIQYEYILSLLYKKKYHEVLLFVRDNISEENKKINKDLNFFLALSLSYECKFEEAREIINKLKKEEIKPSLKDKCDDLLKIMDMNESVIMSGEELYKRGEYEEAIKLYDLTLENKKNSEVFNSIILNKRALCYIKVEKDKASKDIKESTKTKPNYNFSYVANDLDNTEIKAFVKGENDIKQSKELNPSSLDFLQEITSSIKKEKENDKNSEKSPESKKNDKKKEENSKDKNEKNDYELPEELMNLPFTIKSSDNKIERYNDCLNEIPRNKIKIRKENKSNIKEVENKENGGIINDDEISIGLSIFKKGANLKYGLTRNENNKYEKSTMVAMRTLYSITISEDDISLKSSFVEKMENIAKLVYSNEKKAEELENLFQKTGFYIPLKMSIGGRYTFNTEKMTKEQKEELKRRATLDISVKENLAALKNSYAGKKEKEKKIDLLIKSRNFIGGEMNPDWEKWINTVNLENSDFNEYTDFREIFDFLNVDLKNKLARPIELIKEKNKKIINYVKIIEEVKRDIGEQEYIEKYGNLMIGKYNEENPDIYCEKIDLDEKKFLIENKNKVINETYKGIIVGLKILSLQKDDKKNGIYSLKNPMLKNEIKIEFNLSFGFTRSMKYLINVYLMKYPE